jgi:hypothetical protein
MLCEVGAACHENVRLEHGVVGQRDVERGDEHLEVGWAMLSKKDGQLEDSALVPGLQEPVSR